MRPRSASARPSARNAAPDGAGYLIVYAAGGTYDLRPGSTRRITTGQLLAADPTGWLTLECDDRLRCFTVPVDQTEASSLPDPHPSNPRRPDQVHGPAARCAGIRMSAAG